MKGKAVVPFPAEVHYEFGGPLGSALITSTLPLVVLGLLYLCG